MGRLLFILGMAGTAAFGAFLLISEFSPLLLAVLAGILGLEVLGIVTDEDHKRERERERDQAREREQARERQRERQREQARARARKAEKNPPR